MWVSESLPEMEGRLVQGGSHVSSELLGEVPATMTLNWNKVENNDLVFICLF